MHLPSRRQLAALLAMLAAIAVAAAQLLSGSTPAARTVTVKLGPAAARAVPDRQFVAPAAAVKAAATPDALQHAALARDESPPGVSPSALEAGRVQQEQYAAQDQLPISAPDAAPSQAGCRSRFLNVNYSSRRGVAPHIIVLHYTVSPNLPGWADVDGVTAFFDRSATQASSNYVIDGEGHCNYIVREVDKAWAQAAINSPAISIEVINTGRERLYIAAAGLQQLARVVHDAAHRWGIPLRVGAVAGCTVLRPGVVTHQMLGPCGGGHIDVCPYDGTSCSSGSGAQAGSHPEIRQVLAAAAAMDPKPVSRVDVATCARLNHYRRDVRAHVKVSARRTRINVHRRQALAARHVLCTTHGPVHQ